VVIKKKMEPQLAVLVAREACLHSRSVTVESIVSCCDLVAINDSIDFMDMAFGESVLDDAAERPRVLSLDQVALVFTLFGTGNFRIVKVLLEQD
jgi:hypothetical protein